MGLIFAGNKGYGKCRSYNDMCLFLKRYSNTVFLLASSRGYLTLPLTSLVGSN